MQSLAIKYRPQTFEDVVEQSAITKILKQQLETKSFKHAYLFVGGAGTGKTTCARIFAKEINNGNGNPIEMDAASQNGVDDVREIIQQARTKSLDSEYKIFIIDECHAFSNSAWQAMLKLIEEPPAKSIFIFCTTNPEKIPKTIISRVQRYQFQRISQHGIVDRLIMIIAKENTEFGAGIVIEDSAVEYIAKIADGGMRDAITLLDKCLSFSTELTLENVIKALGTVDYDVMFKLTNNIFHDGDTFQIIEDIHNEGKDLKQFIKSYTQFILDVTKYQIGVDWQYMMIPKLSDYERLLDGLVDDYNKTIHLLDTLVKLNADIKYSSTPKYDIEAVLFLESRGVNGTD